MSAVEFAAIGFFVVALLWSGVTFNSLVRLRNRVREAFSGIDVQLKRRHDLVPLLVNSVKGYAGHERRTLEAVVQARAAVSGEASVSGRAQTESGLSAGLDRLLLLSEDYPDLQADEGFRDLQTQLVKAEETIQYTRRYYNGAVRDLNNRVQQFPGNLLAKLFTVRSEEFFELASPGERNAPTVAMETT